MPEGAKPRFSRVQRSQAARRAKVIEAVLQLADAEGYDAVQIRAVSELSGVGTRTIYDYFGSRDALLSAALDVWLDRELLESTPASGDGSTTAEQLLAICRHAWEVWERHPNMLETFMRTAIAPGRRNDGLSDKGIRAFLPHMIDVLAPIDPDYARDVLMILNTETHSLMASRTVDWIPPGMAYELLERTVYRLAQHPAMADHRPASWSYEERSPARRSRGRPK